MATLSISDLPDVNWVQKQNKAFYLFYPIALEGRRGTTAEFATIPYHFVLSSAALIELIKAIPALTLMLSSHLFFGTRFLLFPFTVPYNVVFAKPEDLFLLNLFIGNMVLVRIV